MQLKGSLLNNDSLQIEMKGKFRVLGFPFLFEL